MRALVALAVASAVAVAAYIILSLSSTSTVDCSLAVGIEPTEGEGQFLYDMFPKEGEGPWETDSILYQFHSSDEQGEKPPPDDLLSAAAQAGPGDSVIYEDRFGENTQLDAGDRLILNSGQYFTLLIRDIDGRLLGITGGCQ